MAAVSKVCYEAWEKDVIAAFYTSDNLQSDFRPRDGCLSVVSEEKVVLVVLEGDRRIADMVSFAVETNLPAKSQFQLFHIGKEQVDGVFYGLAENGEFVHPAIDFEGLINCQQKLFQTPGFIQGKQVVVQLHCDCSTVARELLKSGPRSLTNSCRKPCKTIRSQLYNQSRQYSVRVQHFGSGKCLQSTGSLLH